MTFDEKIVEGRIKTVVNDILFNKITDYKLVQQDKSKIWAIINTTDLMELLDHDDCPQSNFISILKLTLDEIKKPNTNWTMVTKLQEVAK